MLYPFLCRVKETQICLYRFVSTPCPKLYVVGAEASNSCSSTVENYHLNSLKPHNSKKKLLQINTVFGHIFKAAYESAR